MIFTQDCRFEVDRDFIPTSKLEVLSEKEFKAVTVPPRKCHEVRVEAKKGDTILWNFKTEEFDIGFKVLCEADGVMTVGYCKVDSQKFLQKGIITVQVSGTC